MSILMVNDWVDFSEMKNLLEITDGNLANHINAFKKVGYIEVKKEFVNKEPRTSYRVTQSGKKYVQQSISIK